MKKLILAGLILSAQLFPSVSQAALFDDTEARKKILELEKTMQSQNQLTQATLAELKKNQQALEQRLTTLEGVAKNGLTDTQEQIESLKQEIARLKGALEEASHHLDMTQQRQKDLYADTDTRLRKLESAPVAAAPATTESSAPAAVEKNSQEFQLLELANGLSKEAKHKDAFNVYDKFLKDYPDSTLAPEAMYGLGYSQFALKNYKSSMATQHKMIEAHPESAKVPDAMLNIANSQIQLGLVPGAKKTLRDLIAKFPNSDVIPTAQKRLKALEAIK